MQKTGGQAGVKTKARTDPVYTTGDIARMLKVAARTVTKWCDAGRLEYHRIPGGESRRIYGSSLLRFAKENDIPLPCGVYGPAVLWCGYPPPEINPRVTVAINEFNLGFTFAELHPAAVVVEAGVLGRDRALTVVQMMAVRRPGLTIIVVRTDDDNDEARWKACGATTSLPYPGIAAPAMVNLILDGAVHE